MHRSATLAQVTTVRNHIPVTKPARSIVDFAETTDRRGLERVVDEADRLGLVKPTQLQAELDRHPGRKGHPLLQAVLDEHAIGTTATANDFEELFLAIVDRHGIPRPIVNRAHGRKRKPDFRWPEHRVIVGDRRQGTPRRPPLRERPGTGQRPRCGRLADAEIHLEAPHAA